MQGQRKQGLSDLERGYRIMATIHAYTTDRNCYPCKVDRPGFSGKIHLVPLAIKGDWVFLRKAMRLATGFSSKRICHLCCGDDALASLVASWF